MPIHTVVAKSIGDPACVAYWAWAGIHLDDIYVPAAKRSFAGARWPVSLRAVELQQFIRFRCQENVFSRRQNLPISFPSSPSKDHWLPMLSSEGRTTVCLPGMRTHLFDGNDTSRFLGSESTTPSAHAASSRIPRQNGSENYTSPKSGSPTGHRCRRGAGSAYYMRIIGCSEIET